MNACINVEKKGQTTLVHPRGPENPDTTFGDLNWEEIYKRLSYI
jgi:hypothetical protein